MKILVPVDMSPRDSIALPYAIRLANALEATVVIAHALRLTRSLIPHAMRQAEAYVTAVGASHRDEGAATESIVRRGDPAGVIIELAAQLPADLILITTRGRSGIGKFVLGSVADAVLSHCNKPVLLLSEAAHVVLSDEETRLQSAYLAAVVRHREARGLYTRDEAQRQLARLAKSGLDPEVLVVTYEARDGPGFLFRWLDHEFQLSALRRFFPDEVEEWVREGLPEYQRERPA
jgi:nucleotide-binding universal stress UspA family protein